jgi:hypothetical protein
MLLLLLRQPPRLSLIRLMMSAAATATTAQATPTDTADVAPSVASFAAPILLVRSARRVLNLNIN